MDKVTRFAGLDYHQQTVQVCVMDAEARIRVNRSCRNDLTEILGVLKSAGKVKAIGLEACCGAAELAEDLAAHGTWQVDLAHAAYVAKIKSSPDKTDYSDAHLLADLTRVGYLPKVWLAPRAIREIRQLVEHRQRLVNQRRDVKLRIGACLREQRIVIQDGGRWSRRWIKEVKTHRGLTPAVRWVISQMFEQMELIEGWIDQAQEQLRAATAGHELIGRLRRIEGIGEVTGWMLLAYIGRFDRFKTGKKLARYCGLSPKNSSSGQKQADGGLIDACRKSLRAVLIQAGQRLIRTEGRWKALAQGMLQRGKPKSLVVAAVANRWMRSVHQRMVGAPIEVEVPE